ncbi:hypothetical protein RFI_06599 [Reticulomyxa filosa]|uniref:Uncharacterized protein n=1 Tax=Reticulomyxa filosa TaxID=46433 RepID=X6NX00_RETFI|nr:hypothetical protein RFI_06599 [Reticulomyxa filosa]|eukprot:ETO30521.1 hypothetical protein RFI_06599 [Reticulomyxa filosa]
MLHYLGSFGKFQKIKKKLDRYRKEVTHGINSARVTMVILKGAPVTNVEKQEIHDIIVQHDKPTGTRDNVQFHFFFFFRKSKDEGKTREEGEKKKQIYMYICFLLIINMFKKKNRNDILELVGLPSSQILLDLQTLMDADAMAFFAYTIGQFIAFKAKTNTPEWIWTRIETNVRRLRPELRSKAVECIMKLDPHLQKLIGFNVKALKPYL